MLSSISPQALKGKIENKEDIIIIDTRLPKFYIDSRISNAINIPFAFEMPKEAYELPRDKEIVVSCYIGLSSKAFALCLAKMGMKGY